VAKRSQDEEKSGFGWWALLRRAGAVLVLLGVVGGAAYAVGPLESRAAQVRADPLEVRFDWPDLAGGGGGTWMPESERFALEQIVRASVSLDPFDGESLARGAAALAATGWFKAGPRLRRLPGGVIRVEGEFRTPAAAVRWRGRDRLVSREGRLLRLHYPEGGAGALPVIKGTFAGPPPREDGSADYGGFWVGMDVQDALSLLTYLWRSDIVRPHVESIDVSGHDETGRLVIVTTEGARLVWGRAPGERHPGEQPDAEKLRRFEALVSDPAWRSARGALLRLDAPVTLYDATASGGRD
jgi:hypothetical protein